MAGPCIAAGRPSFRVASRPGSLATACITDPLGLDRPSSRTSVEARGRRGARSRKGRRPSAVAVTPSSLLAADGTVVRTAAIPAP